MEEMQITSALTWIEVQFMKKAVEEVEKCRTTLKWTYAMAYYLAKGNEKELFEDNQRYFRGSHTPSGSNAVLRINKGILSGQSRTFQNYWSHR